MQAVTKTFNKQFTRMNHVVGKIKAQVDGLQAEQRVQADLRRNQIATLSSDMRRLEQKIEQSVDSLGMDVRRLLKRLDR